MLLTTVFTLFDIIYLIIVILKISEADLNETERRNGSTKIIIGGLETNLHVLVYMTYFIETTKYMLCHYHSILLIFTIHYASQVLTYFSNKIIMRQNSRFDFGNQNLIFLKRWKEISDLFDSINKAVGLYVLIFFPSVILIVIMSICTSFIQAFSQEFFSPIFNMAPAFWFLCRMLIVIEVGEHLDKTVCEI